MNITYDMLAVLSAIVMVAGAFAVMAFRIGDLTRRITRLEESERNHSDRVVKIETKLESVIELLQRIADKLKVD